MQRLPDGPRPYRNRTLMAPKKSSHISFQSAPISLSMSAQHGKRYRIGRSNKAEIRPWLFLIRARQRHLYSCTRLTFESAVSEVEARQGLVILIIDGKFPLSEHPMAAGKEFARAATVRRNGSLLRTRSTFEFHTARWCVRRDQHPAAGHIRIQRASSRLAKRIAGAV